MIIRLLVIIIICNKNARFSNKVLFQFVIKCALIDDEQFSQNDTHFVPVFIWYILVTVD